MSRHELQVTDLAVTDRYGNSLVQPCSFTLAPGAALTIIGESGSGKSLLVQAIMGTLAPALNSTGQIRLGNASTASTNAELRRPWWGHSLALLPQEPWLALDPTMPADRQVAESYQLIARPGLSRAQAMANARADLQALGVNTGAQRYPFMLSGGMAQRVAFAATRAGGAPIVILDEPTKGLDEEARASLLDILHTFIAQGGSVLTITHDLHVARSLGGEVMVMKESAVLEQGTATSVLQTPKHAYTQALLAADPEHWQLPLSAPATGTAILSGQGLSKRFGDHTLFKELDITIHAGERIAINGPSGAGKTTLGNMLLGLVKPDSGLVTRASGLAQIKLQKLYQDPVSAFAPRLPLKQAFADLIKQQGLNPAELPMLLDRLGLDAALLERLPSQVSGGELQRLALARILMLSPALIFADEPTSRLDPISQQITMQLLLESAAERDCAILLVTHDRALAQHTMQRQLQISPVV
ncbi:ATP-binding cassette domain-containing protein [Methylobacillus methanolivorans]